MSAPRVHILLLNWNGWSDTLECLDTLLRLDYPNYQIVICDNASSDDSLAHIRRWTAGAEAAPPPSERLRRLLDTPRAEPEPFAEIDRATAESGGTTASQAAKVLLIHNGENLGFAGGSNVGIRYAIASRPRDADTYVCLLNNDTVVSSDWLSRMIGVTATDDTIGATGAMLWEYHEPDLVESAGGGRVHRWQGMPRGTTATRKPRGSEDVIPRRLDFLTGACMLVRTSVLERVGLIDERYFVYCEDIDLSLRIRALGLRIAFVPDAELWHKAGGVMKHSSPRHDYYMVRNSLLLVHKFYPVMLPAAMLFSLYRCTLPKVVRGDWKRLAADVSAYKDFLAFAVGRASGAGVGASVPPRS